MDLVTDFATYLFNLLYLQTMKKATKQDEFHLQTFLQGLGLMLLTVDTNFYEYCYHITFKTVFKTYKLIFNEPYEKPVDAEFFRTIENPTVQHCCKLQDLIYSYYEGLAIRACLLEDLLLEDESLTPEANRYAPKMITAFYNKSYSYMVFNYQRYLEEINNTLYYYCCALTLNSYQIPLKMRVRLDYTYQGSFRYLNLDNPEVAHLIDLMLAIEEEIEVFKRMKK